MGVTAEWVGRGGPPPLFRSPSHHRHSRLSLDPPPTDLGGQKLRKSVRPFPAIFKGHIFFKKKLKEMTEKEGKHVCFSQK